MLIRYKNGKTRISQSLDSQKVCENVFFQICRLQKDLTKMNSERSHFCGDLNRNILGIKSCCSAGVKPGDQGVIRFTRL